MFQCKDLNKSYGTKSTHISVLRNINFKIDTGEMVAIMGPSGSGKSTLLKILGSLLPFDSGEYLYNGTPLEIQDQKQVLAFRRNELGFILQDFGLINEYTVEENLLLALKYHVIPKKEQKLAVRKVLKEVDLLDKIHTYPQELSGGQQQRVAIARAILKKPSLILADEPTGSLDSTTGKQIIDILLKINKKGTTIVLVTHDESIAKKCKRILFLKDGEMVQDTFLAR